MSADAPSPFPSFPGYQTPEVIPATVRLSKAKSLRDYAASNLAEALRNVELAELAAKAADAEYRAVVAEVEYCASALP